MLGDHPARAKADRTSFEEKIGMLEATSTYLWQTHRSVDAKIPCASAPPSPFRIKSVLNLACVDEVSAGRLHSLSATDASMACGFTALSRTRNSSLDQTSSPHSSCRSVPARPGIQSADSFETKHADMGISVPVSLFFFCEKHIRPVVSV